MPLFVLSPIRRRRERGRRKENEVDKERERRFFPSFSVPMTEKKKVKEGERTEVGER